MHYGIHYKYNSEPIDEMKKRMFTLKKNLIRKNLHI